jgi:phosphoribosylanthranilate isomerase
VTLGVKICGLTTREAVEAACDAGADALGFVFTESPRRLSPEQARALTAGVPRHVLRIAVTRHPDQALVTDIAAVFRPHRLQADAEDFQALTLPFGLEPLPVLRDGAAAPTPLPDLFLYEGVDSGRGLPADWSRARDLARHGGLILAGGLSAANVAQAVASVRPYGVDVSSGVERAPGVKDSDQIRAFVAAVRRAAEVTGETQ